MKLKNLLANKNVVTIFGAILIVIVLYAFYNWRVKQAIDPIRVPVASKTIGPRTEITLDMITYIDIQQSAVRSTVLTNVNNDNQPKKIVGRYTNVNCTIPAGSFFFEGMIVLPNELPDSFLRDIDFKEGMVAYNYAVNIESTFGNSIYPGNYIDMYFRSRNDEGKVVFGKLVQNVKVLAVKDSSGNHVFENMEERRDPAQIIFAVTPEIHALLRAAETISGDLIISPTNVSYTASDTNEIVTEISSEEVKAFIEDKIA